MKSSTHYALGQKADPDIAKINFLYKPDFSLAFASLLKVGDEAFILRSDKSWTYSVVAKKEWGDDPFIEFVVDDSGSMKKLTLKRWADSIRPVKAQSALDATPNSSRNSLQMKKTTEGRLPKSSSAADVSKTRPGCLRGRNRRASEGLFQTSNYNAVFGENQCNENIRDKNKSLLHTEMRSKSMFAKNLDDYVCAPKRGSNRLSGNDFQRLKRIIYGENDSDIFSSDDDDIQAQALPMAKKIPMKYAPKSARKYRNPDELKEGFATSPKRKSTDTFDDAEDVQDLFERVMVMPDES